MKFRCTALALRAREAGPPVASILKTMLELDTPINGGVYTAVFAKLDWFYEIMRADGPPVHLYIIFKLWFKKSNLLDD
jgi:hypothetical protein